MYFAVSIRAIRIYKYTVYLYKNRGYFIIMCSIPYAWTTEAQTYIKVNYATYLYIVSVETLQGAHKTSHADYS